jgi:alkanal monooxygenase alpha chain
MHLTMTKIHWGAYLTTVQLPGRGAADVFEDTLFFARLAEELGFDSIWLLEHHFTRYGICGDTLSLAAFLLGRTRRIRVGTAVIVLPLDHPLKTAERIAMLDHLSNGRLMVGIGRGTFVKDFKVFGHDMSKSHVIMRESTEIMLRAWRDGSVAWDSEQFKFDRVDVNPRPFTQPHPPLYVASASPSTVEWAASRGFPMMLEHQLEDERKLSALELYGEVAARAGHDPQRISHVLSGAAAVIDGPEDHKTCVDNLVWWCQEFARASQIFQSENRMENYAFHWRRFEEATMRGESADPEEGVRKLMDVSFYGSPESITRKLQNVLDLTGIRQVILGFEAFGSRKLVQKSMERFAREVMPAVKAPA